MPSSRGSDPPREEKEKVIKKIMRIGILGGTFNPVHLGHLHLAEEALRELGLEKVILVPAFIPPHKTDEDIISAGHRYRMALLAAKGKPNLEVSDFEIRTEGKSYTVRTLQEFKKRFGPKTELFFLTGSDSLKELLAWKDLEKIFKLAHFVVVPRPGYPMDEVVPGASILSIPEVDISSSQIRERIRKGLSIREAVPEPVCGYIEKNRLYI